MVKAKTGNTGRKSDVLAAAVTLFAEQGYSAVGVDEIGERAGITGPAIYNHFDCKEALLAAVILDVSERFAEIAEATTSQRTGDPRKDLRHLVDLTTTMTLDLADETHVYIREMPRLRAKDRRAVEGVEARLLLVARELVFAIAPGLSEQSFALRSAFVSGAATAVAREKSLLRRSALQTVISDAVYAVLQAPAPAATSAPQKPPAKQARPWLTKPSRRDEILAIATQLFGERSYHAVSMEDIGAAAGISAAAIYRHFASKADIVNEAFVRVGSRVIIGMDRALRQASTTEEALEGLARSMAFEALDSGDLLAVLGQTIRELNPEDAARELRGRRQIVDTWTHVVRVARPELPEPHARVLARAAIAAITQASLLPQAATPDADELAQLSLILIRS